MFCGHGRRRDPEHDPHGLRRQNRSGGEHRDSRAESKACDGGRVLFVTYLQRPAVVVRTDRAKAHRSLFIVTVRNPDEVADRARRAIGPAG